MRLTKLGKNLPGSTDSGSIFKHLSFFTMIHTTDFYSIIYQIMVPIIFLGKILPLANSVLVLMFFI